MSNLSEFDRETLAILQRELEALRAAGLAILPENLAAEIGSLIPDLGEPEPDTDALVAKSARALRIRADRWAAFRAALGKPVDDLSQ